MAKQEGKRFSAYLRKAIEELPNTGENYDLDNLLTRERWITGFMRNDISIRVNRG